MDETTLPNDLAPSPGRSKAPWIVGATLLLAAGVVGYFLFFGSDEGIVEFQLSDPKAAVRYQIDGKDFMPDADHAARLPAGKYELTVSGKDYETENIQFRARRGAREIVKVPLRLKPKTPEPVVKIDPEENRRQTKAAKLVDQAAELLDDNKPKDAIPLLDKALKLNPKSAPGYALRGRAHFLQGDPGKAHDDETESSKLLGDNPQLLLLKAMVSLRADPRSASAMAARALQDDAKLVFAQALIGESLLRQGKLTDGIAACDQALKKDGRILLAWRNRALAYGSLGQWDKALADLDTVIKLDDNDAYAHWAKAAVFEQLGKPEPAKAERASALKLDSKLAKQTGPIFASRKITSKIQAEELADQADAALRRQNLDKAAELAEAALTLNAKCALALACRATVRFLHDEKENAKADCNQAIKLDSREWRAYLTRALLYAGDEKDADKVVADATVAVTLSPDRSPAYTRRALGYLRLHDYQQSIADGDAALKDSPAPDPKTYLQLGEAHAYIGQLDKALANFDQFVRLHPKDPNGYFWRAGVYLKREDPIKMLAELTKVTELDTEQILGDPPEPPVFPAPSKDKLDLPAAKYVERARENEKAGKLDRAIADWTIALRLEPKWHFERGVAYFARGDFAQADSDFNEAIRRALNRAELHWRLAEARGRIGDLPEAVTAVNEALALDGKNAKYLWYRAALRERLDDSRSASDRKAALELDPTLAKAPPPTFPDLANRLLPRSTVFIPWGGDR